jgi:two-component system, OmpR family, sensor histidine kinase BaeS
MKASDTNLSAEDYYPTLVQYLQTHGEEPLYRAGLLSQSFIESGLGPEDIIALHCDAIEHATRKMPAREHVQASIDAHQFLLEVMIAYGIKFREYLELRLAQAVNDAGAQAKRDRERQLEAERLEREKDELLAAVAHELRTPITVIQGNIDRAARSLMQGRVDPVPKYLSSAREAIERLSRLSADLVESNKHGATPLNLVPLDVLSVVAQAIRWARPTALAKGVDVVYQPGTEPQVVLGDSDALLSVFGNLLSNAIRYTSAGGRIAVRFGRRGNLATVEVQDTGMGMTDDVIARVFDKFYRGPEARAADAQGLGLGLSLVRQMIDEHSGSIEVESVQGHGSTFRVLIPVFEKDNQELSDG